MLKDLGVRAFNSLYFSLGDKEGDAWREDRKFMTKTPIEI